MRAQLLAKKRPEAPDLRKPAEPAGLPPKAKLAAREEVRDKDRDRGRENNRDRGREKDRDRGREKDRDRGREKDRDRGREKDRGRGRDKGRDEEPAGAVLKPNKPQHADAAGEAQAERRQCPVCGRWIQRCEAAWSQHQMSIYHQKARLRQSGMKEPRLSEKAKEVSERLWSAYYSEHGSDKTVAAEPELSKTEKRKARQARADALAEEKQKKKKKNESPVVDRTAEPRPPGPPGPPPAGGGDGGMDKGAILSGLFQQALQALQTF